MTDTSEQHEIKSQQIDHQGLDVQTKTSPAALPPLLHHDWKHSNFLEDYDNIS